MFARLLLVLALLLSCSTGAFAARRVKLVDLRDQPVPSIGAQPAAQETLEKAMRSALAAQKWTIKSAEPGHIVANLVVRSKHFVEADIRFNPSVYSIVYRSSVNLNFKIDKKGTRIHPNYMKWVRWLGDEFERNVTSS